MSRPRRRHGLRLAAAGLAAALLAGGASAKEGAPTGDAKPPREVVRTVGPPAHEPLRGEALDRRVDRLASRMRCPVCQGLSVADSPSESARNMRQRIRDLLAAGFGEQQVLDYFVSRYGEFVRLAPRAEGFPLLVWLLPGLGLLAGVAIVVATVRRNLRSDAGGASATEADEGRS